MRGPWPNPRRANMFASCKKHLSSYSCASLVPHGMRWARVCAGEKNVLGVVCLCCVCVRACCTVMQCVVIIVVVVLLVASALPSMRWLLCGQKVRVQKKKSVTAHELHQEKHFPLRLYLIQKISLNQITNITVFINSKTKDTCL